MKKYKGVTAILVLTLLFLTLSTVSPNIDILDLGSAYNCIEHYGFVDYLPNNNSTGVISIFIDDEMVLNKTLNMSIRYFHGFECNPIKTLDFSLNETEGNHSIVALISSQNITAQRGYEYYVVDWWLPEPEEVEETIEDWMVCP